MIKKTTTSVLLSNLTRQGRKLNIIYIYGAKWSLLVERQNSDFHQL